MDVFEVDVGVAHQFGLDFVVADVFHSDGGGDGLPVFFWVYDLGFVFFLLVWVFVIDVGVDCGQGSVHFAADAAEFLCSFFRLEFFIAFWSFLFGLESLFLLLFWWHVNNYILEENYHIFDEYFDC